MCGCHGYGQVVRSQIRIVKLNFVSTTPQSGACRIVFKLSGGYGKKNCLVDPGVKDQNSEVKFAETDF